MTIESLRKTARDFGWAAAVHDVTKRAANRLAFVKIIRCMKLSPERVDASFLELDGGLEGRFLTPDELYARSADEALDLPRDFLDGALAEGDRCYGILKGGELVSYGWYSRRPTPMNSDLVLRFDPAYVYMYKGLTLPAYRGKRLHAVGMARALMASVEAGAKAIVSYVESNNWSSLKSCYRLGYQDVGTIYITRVAGRYFTRAVGDCAAYGLSVEATGKAAGASRPAVGLVGQGALGMSLRFRVADVLDRLGVLETALRTRGLLELPLLTVITYHRVGYPGAGPLELDDDVLDATPEELDAQVAMLRRSFSIIGVDELHAHFAGGTPLPPNPAVITFDDGYRECLTQALPILRRHQAKAVFFIASRYPEQKRLYWWDTIALLVRKARTDRLKLRYPVDLELETATAAPVLQRIVKTHCDLDIDRFLDELAAAAGVAFRPEEEAQLAQRLLMSWDDVRALRDAGMDIESHTRTHRVLHTVPAHELAAELEGARHDIEAQIDAPVRALAYPVGRPVLDEERLPRAIRRAGYSIGFSNGTGLSLLRDGFDPLDIRRIAVDRAAPAAYLRAAMSLPLFAHAAPQAHRVSVPPPPPAP